MTAVVLESGSYYRIIDSGKYLILEDMTKRGLRAGARTRDNQLGVDAEMGTIHDMDGIGHSVPLRWFFPKSGYELGTISRHAASLESRYARLRELTCPD